MDIKKIAITTDTNSGMLPGEYDKDGVFVLPMPFVIDGECLLESVELSRQKFYEKLIGGSKVSTAQPSVGEVSEFWKNILKEYDEIVHIPTASDLSNAYATAKALAKDFDGKIHLVDNHRISIPLQTSVWDAVKLREQGKSAEEIAETLESMACDYSLYVSLESMEYLKRGGRISPTVAAIGSMLKLRPVLHLNKGKLEKFAMPRTPIKAKETMKAAIRTDLTETFHSFTQNGEMQLAVVYCQDKQEALPLEEEIKKLYPDIPFVGCVPMSLSVACHTGPGSLAIACMRVVK